MCFNNTTILYADQVLKSFPFEPVNALVTLTFDMNTIHDEL